MIDEWLVQRPWPIIPIWAASYCADYYLTIWSARLYRQGINEHIVFEGSFELTPQFQRDIDALRTVSPRFVLHLLLSCLMLPAMWYLLVRLLFLPELYSFFVGAVLLREGAVFLRHFRNLMLFRYGRDHSGLQGKIEYRRWLVLRLSAVDVLGFAGLYLFLFALAGSWFLLGGAFGCAVIAAQHWRLAEKAKGPSP